MMSESKGRLLELAAKSKLLLSSEFSLLSVDDFELPQQGSRQFTITSDFVKIYSIRLQNLAVNGSSESSSMYLALKEMTENIEKRVGSTAHFQLVDMKKGLFNYLVLVADSLSVIGIHRASKSRGPTAEELERIREGEYVDLKLASEE